MIVTLSLSLLAVCSYFYHFLVITWYCLYTYLQGESHVKLSKSKLTFKKPSNWLPFVRICAIPDPVQIKAFAKMKQAVPEIDPVRWDN